MKRIAGIFTFCILAFLCFVTSNGLGVKQPASAGTLIGGIPENMPLPFGSPVLVTHKFPKHWSSGNIYDQTNASVPHQKELETVSAFYEKLGQGKSFAFPVFNRSEHIKAGKNYCQCSDSISIDSCKFRLPDLGKYECYYVAGDAYSGNRSFEKYCKLNTCLRYGDLVLYDRQSRKIKVLPAYFEGSGDSYTAYRYFYITQEKTIRIFEGSCYDDGCSLINQYTITVLHDGSINIVEHK